jgi:hypothetical protein
MSQDLKAEVLRLKEQVAELSRVKDHIEICKLQSRYAHLYFMLRNSEIPSLFAQKTPGVSIALWAPTGWKSRLPGVSPACRITRRINRPLTIYPTADTE